VYSIAITRKFLLYAAASVVCVRKFRYSFICQGTSARRQRNDLFGSSSQPPGSL